MRPGGGKSKGAAFEREVCVALSLWVSHGKNKDLFWRSAMSGGRATVAHRKGDKLSRVAGDICATAPEGHVLTDRFYFELKAYKELHLDRFLFLGSGPTKNFWDICKREAARYDREPVLVVRHNGMPALVITGPGTITKMVGSVVRVRKVMFNIFHGYAGELVKLDQLTSHRFRG